MLTLYLGVSPYLGMLAGGGVALATGLIVGLICLRLRGIYVGMVTFAIHLVLPTLFIAAAAIGTGGTYGLFGIPPLNVGAYVFSKLEMVPWYYAAMGMFAGFLFLIYKIINSPIGLAFVALRDSEPFAKRLGVNEYKYMVIVFGIAAFISGVAGGFYVHYMGVISPAIFRLEFFLFALVMVMLGGMGRFPGAAIGAFVVIFLNDAARGVGMARLTILGAIVVGVMLVLPGGLIGIPEAIARLIRRTSKKTPYSPVTKQEE
jgi:branched-chain amino acid transport system permease protein